MRDGVRGVLVIGDSWEGGREGGREGEREGGRGRGEGESQ